ncbi:DNA-binding PadR family transcriptional regulator [Bradyrhizobium sp. USDA 4532]|uniref:PadR family transcriptional regulator n=2 Tax=Bradyrhizobium TaxID=374 RepID=UPI001FCDF45C|nr:PadR family transcriptional regulator [Bradyrhizobium brasilense]MCP1833654.1 DNA-binding PadR family transcriptional regulator [Bradyrhizobium sp. USDA 4545]MCP1918398.1 DNA-binding PadR family transcriptional regulator [Bradyrhizobium sp. USDA 4532]
MRRSMFRDRDDDGFRFGFFAMGRHGRGGHRFGRGGHGFFGRGGGGDFPGSRRLSSQDLQLVILALLGEQPAHGYELIKRIEERSDGFYSPSPGVIYPALTFLEEIGHASVTQDAARKLYSITEQGRAYLGENRATADTILEALSRIGRRMEEVREAFAGVSDLDGEASDEVHRARHALKSALRQKRGCDTAEARRIAKILDRAAAEILQQ